MRYTSLVLAGALAGTVLTAPAAAADYSAQPPGWERCPKGTVCLWQHEDGLGRRTIRPPTGPGDANFHDNPCSGCRSSTNRRANGTWGDTASSVYNRTDYTIFSRRPVRYCFYFDVNFNKRRGGVPDVKLLPGQSANLTGINQDQISSGKPC